ncbi:tRNA pseudouridine synthase 1 [Intoshia linei]|uniref:tRNA pseudouridine synthase 1 n=1 Tax=Intoshia linei TaxID=1819745 RepID=A0A177B7G6_9BILA|nr:tRNA pseudouridine synthase 1 [Intoshia linei]
MSFQRAARTDKSVSALGNVVSAKVYIDVKDSIQTLNSNLPKDIKIIGNAISNYLINYLISLNIVWFLMWINLDIIKTNRAFSSKNCCSSRTYAYTLPTFAFSNFTEIITDCYRISKEKIDLVNKLLSRYKGTKNFHNFTSGKEFDEENAKRFIMNIQFKLDISEGIEFGTITIKGQSFMLHQIRKMIGFVIAIIRGHLTENSFDTVFDKKKMDIPKAPGLGLRLESVNYDAYNVKMKKLSDSIHKEINWDVYRQQIDNFRNDVLLKHILKVETTERPMMNWLNLIKLNHYGVHDEKEKFTTIGKACKLIM